MNKWRFTSALMVMTAIMVSSCSAGTPGNAAFTVEPPIAKVSTSTSLPIEVPTLTALPVDYAVTIKDFAGKWVGYSVITQNPDQPSGQKTGMRLEIAVDRFVADGQTCAAPKYEAKNISLKEFLAGLKRPDALLELNQEEFPQLQSNCPQIKPQLWRW